MKAWADLWEPIRSTLSAGVQAQGFKVAPYERAGFSFQTDGEKAQPEGLKPGRFVLERRAGRGFDEDIFYSEAPLSTAAHRDLLELVEASAARP